MVEKDNYLQPATILPEGIDHMVGPDGEIVPTLPGPIQANKWQLQFSESLKKRN